MKLSTIKKSIDIYLDFLKIDPLSIYSISFKNFFNNNIFKKKTDIQILLEFYEKLPKTIMQDNTINDRYLTEEELHKLMLILLKEKTSVGTEEKDVFNRIKYSFDLKLVRKCINEYNNEQELSFEKFQRFLYENRTMKLNCEFKNNSSVTNEVLPEIWRQINGRARPFNWNIDFWRKEALEKVNDIELSKMSNPYANHSVSKMK